MKYLTVFVVGMLCACVMQSCYNYRTNLQVMHGCP